METTRACCAGHKNELIVVNGLDTADMNIHVFKCIYCIVCVTQLRPLSSPVVVVPYCFPLSFPLWARNRSESFHTTGPIISRRAGLEIQYFLEQFPGRKPVI